MGQFDKTFTKNAPYYHSSRPDYPDTFITLVREKCAISSESIIADIGSGTGKSSYPFLQLGATVYGIEPNEAMRVEAEKHLKNYANFISIASTAEEIALYNNTVDLICVGQALHWFNFTNAKREFIRIGKPEAHIAVFWNQPNKEHAVTDSLFSLVNRFRIDPEQTLSKVTSKTRVNEFFNQEQPDHYTLTNMQQLNYEGFLARLLSISHLPQAGSTQYDSMLQELRNLFEQHARNNMIELQYHTLVFISKISTL